MSNIIVTSPGILEGTEYMNEYVRDTMQSPISGDYCPTGLAGYVVGECTVVCHECIGNEDSDADDPYPIFGDSETDFPGHICEDCQKTLGTHILVYQSQNPGLYYKLKMAEQMSEYNTLPTVEAIGRYVESESYAIGFNKGGMKIDKYLFAEERNVSADEITREEIAEENPRLVEPPTDSASYANHTLPELRATAGYEDTGKGTYTQPPVDLAHTLLNEGAMPAFRRGYADARLGRDFGESELPSGHTADTGGS